MLNKTFIWTVYAESFQDNNLNCALTTHLWERFPKLNYLKFNRASVGSLPWIVYYVTLELRKNNFISIKKTCYIYFCDNHVKGIIDYNNLNRTIVFKIYSSFRFLDLANLFSNGIFIDLIENLNIAQGMGHSFNQLLSMCNINTITIPTNFQKRLSSWKARCIFILNLLRYARQWIWEILLFNLRWFDFCEIS